MTHSYNPQRRTLLVAGGGLLVLAATTKYACAKDVIEIEMSGSSSGSHVWFKPRGLLIPKGTTVRWINSDKGNSHTITAYHPDNGKSNRIPNAADPWDSGYIMPGNDYEHTFDVEGVYDYFCIPHEQAGMVGRIIVGDVPGSDHPYEDSNSKLPKAAVDMLPTVKDILAHKTVE